MRSFISSSDATLAPTRSAGSRPLALPLLSWTVLLVVAYAAFIQIWHRGIEVWETEWARNGILAERYVYADNPEAVVVGSSLVSRLPDASLGPRTYNLGLAGEGSLTGLELVLRAERKPSIVVIETNEIMLPVDRRFLDTI